MSVRVGIDMVKKSEAAGSILSGIFNNPGIILLAALGIGLFLFRDKISQFFSDITGGAAGAAQIAETGGILGSNLTSNLRGIQDIFSGDIFKGIELPSFEFPTIELPSFELPAVELPIIPGITDIFTPRDESTDITDTPAAEGRATDRGRSIRQTPEQMINENFNVQTQLDQQFQGGGLSFIGGSVSEIPIERLSLGQIVDQFDVTASQAANLRAIAQGFTPEEEAFLNIGQELSPLGDLANVPQTSQGFEGLTPEEIALRLTGGIISNF